MSGIKELLGDTPFPPAEFHGETFNYSRDYERLSAQAKRVAEVMISGEWKTLSEIRQETGDPEASISARLRDIRAAGIEVEKEYVTRGLWRYRITKLKDTTTIWEGR